jgi:hypothetical protein
MEYEDVMTALRNADRLAQGGDQQAARDARRLAQIANELWSQRRDPALNQVNLGIADALGGFIDFINPFDTPAVSQALGLGDRLTTGSAREGMVSGMQAIGAAGEDRAPQGVGGAALRGAGQAAGALPLIPLAGNALAARGGVIGNAGREITRGVSTPGAMAMEVAAGGASGGAMRAAEDAGLPDWAVGAAGVAAPLGLAAGTYAATRGPVGAAIRQSGRAAVGAIAPYTNRGAMNVARRAMTEYTGSRDRSIDLGDRINPQDPFARTPAQQTGDPMLMALEQAAARRSPDAREILRQRFDESMGIARSEVRNIGGDAEDARTFFRERRAQYINEMQNVASRAIRNAENRLRDIRSSRSPSQNSTIVMEEIDNALTAARARERELWYAVPMVRQVGTENARRVVQEIIAETGDELMSDIPAEATRRLVDEATAYLDGTNMRNLHALYSRLRQTAREASSGQAPNENRARIANLVADAILEDVAAAGIREMDDARAFSRALHETFDRGAYERLSRQTIQGDTVVDPRVALDRSVSRGETGAMVDAENLESAAAGLAPSGAPGPANPRASNAIQDYILGRFERSAFTAEGTLTRVGALRFVRDNRELLEMYPGLREEILGAADQAASAEQVSRIASDYVERVMETPYSRIADAPNEAAVRAIVDAENPARAAISVVQEARADETGRALAGVKAVFVDDIISRATSIVDGRNVIDADAMLARMSNPNFMTAMSRILDPDEIRRLERVVGAVRTMTTSPQSGASIDPQNLSGARAPVLLQNLLRWMALDRLNATSPGGPGSLAQAQMLSGRVRDIIQNLTQDRASQIIYDAIIDEAGDGSLMRALLINPESARFEREALPRLIPYLVGGGAAATVQDEPQPGPLRMTLTDPGNQRRNQ